MFLSVKELELHKISFDKLFEPGQIGFAGEDLELGSPLHVTGVAELLDDSGGQLRVRGKYTAEILAQCHRCLVRVRYPLATEFDLFYQPASDAPEEEEVKIGAGEADIGFYEDGLELGDILQEQILLALPMQRVCSETCKGICPVCGKNRNESSCDCKPVADNRWNALRNLNI
ncbi:MAG: DUF177 domain-containing protein [Candidatus Solibacter sp.]